MSTVLILIAILSLLGGWRRFSERREKLTRYFQAHKPVTAPKRRIEAGL